MKLKYEFSIREIMGEYALVPMGDSALQLNGMILTNAVGAFVCENLVADTTEENLLQAVLNEFEVDVQTAKTDVSEFLQYLRKAQLLLEE